jgi:hypothetical protein
LFIFISFCHCQNISGVVRVGGRSKEDKLAEFQLKEIRSKRRKSKFEDNNKQERGRVWKEKKNIEREHSPKQASHLIAEGYKGVLSLRLLGEFIQPHHLQCFSSDAGSIEKNPEDAILLKWLNVKRKYRCQDKGRRQMFETDDFKKVVSLREFEDEEDDDNDPDRRNEYPPVVACYVHDAEGPEELYNNLEKCMTMSEEAEESIKDIFGLSHHGRWDLYRLWRNKLEQKYQQNIRDSQDDGYETALMKLSEINEDENLDILAEAKVIGMTTTCAAKYRDLLQRVRPKIVLVEEAAEVLEAHILTSLPLDCDHVILIGDHQQLRPSCTVYELSKTYNLNISMFERLVKLRMPCQKLTVGY